MQDQASSKAAAERLMQQMLNSLLGKATHHAYQQCSFERYTQNANTDFHGREVRDAEVLAIRSP